MPGLVTGPCLQFHAETHIVCAASLRLPSPPGNLRAPPVDLSSQFCAEGFLHLGVTLFCQNER